MTVDEWFSLQVPGKGELEEVVGRLYEALECSRPLRVVRLGSPWALKEAVNLVSLVDRPRPQQRWLERLRSFGPHPERGKWQLQWDASGPGRFLGARSETVTRALTRPLQPSESSLWKELEASTRAKVTSLLPTGPGATPEPFAPQRAEFHSLGLKLIARGVSRYEGIPWSLNLDRLWGTLYAAQALPDQPWLEPLAELTRRGGWLALFDSIALLCDGPQQGEARRPPLSSVRHNNLWPEHWALQELPHGLDGPALSWPDGWEIWACTGLPLPEEILKAPTLAGIQALDEASRRAALYAVGERLLQQGVLPDDLARLARYLRPHPLTRRDLPSSARPWPSGCPLPRPVTSDPWPELSDGLYFQEYPGGQLSLLARARAGRLEKWLLLADGEPTAYWGEGYFYYRSAQMEAFGPHLEDPPTAARASFASWVQLHMGKLLETDSL